MQEISIGIRAGFPLPGRSAYAADMEISEAELKRMNELVAGRVHKLLAERGLKQEVLAAALGVKQGTVSRLLNGRPNGTRPTWTLAYLRPLATFFKCDMAFFVPSERELQTGKLEPREITAPSGMMSAVPPKVTPQLEAFLDKWGPDVPPRAQHALALSKAVPAEGEDSDAFYWKLIDVIVPKARR